MKKRLLDLFCKAGGAGQGYVDAGFEVVGVDIEPQKRYKAGEFVCMDAFEYLEKHGSDFDIIHASPPCQIFSQIQSIRGDRDTYKSKRVDLLTPMRVELIKLGKPYIIENVMGAKKVMKNPLMLCGTMFGLQVLRHRLFESNLPLHVWKLCKHNGTVANGEYMGVYGKGGKLWRNREAQERQLSSTSVADWRTAMGIDWMMRYEITQAIPPAYTKYLGKQAIRLL